MYLSMSRIVLNEWLIWNLAAFDRDYVLPIMRFIEKWHPSYVDVACSKHMTLSLNAHPTGPNAAPGVIKVRLRIPGT